MQSFFLLLAAALGTSAAVAPRAPLEISTPVPGAAQCEPLLITWSGGNPPYVVAYARVLHEIPHVNHARSSAFKLTPSSRRPSLTSGWLPAPASSGSSMPRLVWSCSTRCMPPGQSLILEVTDDEATGLHTVTSAPFNVIAGGTSLPRLRFAISLTCAMPQPEMGASMGTESGGFFIRRERPRRPGMTCKNATAQLGAKKEIGLPAGSHARHLLLVRMRHGRKEGDESARQRAAAPGHRPHRASGAGCACGPAREQSWDMPASRTRRLLGSEAMRCARLALRDASVSKVAVARAEPARFLYPPPPPNF
ncbi:hypothetical protein FB451DRAFT_1372340 [Mycena latifolia]|nr:hypothetical protein FB451DRAFT_1372340 [Mycena latifolia]